MNIQSLDLLLLFYLCNDSVSVAQYLKKLVMGPFTK